MAALRRFWIELEASTDTPMLQTSYGLTAFSLEDALDMLRAQVFVGANLPPIKSCQENIDVRKLDKNHVVPNMGVVVMRGIWWPNLSK